MVWGTLFILVAWSLLPTGVWFTASITTVNNNELKAAESKTPEVDLYQRFWGFFIYLDYASKCNELN